MSQEGTIVVVYGPPGTGKTTENIYSFAGCGLFCHMNGALVTADTVVKYVPPARMVIQTLQQAIGIILQAKAAGYSAVVIDDATLLMKLGDWPLLEASNALIDTKSGVKKGHDRQMWNQAREIIRTFAMVARNSGLVIVLNCHEQAPAADKGMWGGPDFGWDKLVDLVPHVGDVILRARPRPPFYEDGVTPRPRWDTVAACDTTDPQWYAKDRYNVAPPLGPLNVAEMLRAGGRPVPRPKGMEWMEDVAQTVATKMIGGEPQKVVTTWAKEELQRNKIPDPLIQWAVRDGVHRSRFWSFRKSILLEGF